MATFLKSLILAFLVSFGATALAQCIPMNGPGPPRIFDPVRGCYVPQGMQSQGYGGQIIAQPYYGGQQVVAVPQYGYPTNGIPVSAAPAGCAVMGAGTGSLLGWLLDHRSRGAVVGAILGGALGYYACYNGAGQQVMTVPQQQQVAGQYGPGMQVPPMTVAPQVGVPAVSQNHCAHDPGTAPGILNLPGHPMDGKTVCAKPGDTNISRWL